MGVVRLDSSHHATAAAVPAIRREVVAFAEACGVTTDVLDSVALSVSEAVTNVVLHAYPDGGGGPLHVIATSDGDGLTVVITDEGIGMTPRVDSPGLGLGLAIIASVCPRVDVERQGRGTSVRMAFEGAGATA